MKRIWWIASFVVIGLGCGSALRDEPSTAPLAVRSDKLATGQRVFMMHCNQCHPGGAAGLAPAINNKPLPQWLMKFQVRHGLGAMPKFDENHISDDDLDAVVVYLQKLRADTDSSSNRG